MDLSEPFKQFLGSDDDGKFGWTIIPLDFAVFTGEVKGRIQIWRLIHWIWKNICTLKYEIFPYNENALSSDCNNSDGKPSVEKLVLLQRHSCRANLDLAHIWQIIYMNRHLDV